MIPPRKVKFMAKKKENENIRFRSYLKIHADGTELDEQFFRLHNELFEEYDCRPENCKKYPYTNQPERLWSLYSVLEAVEVCPVAFEIYERLKCEYRFKARQ